jgi:alkylation response protein AidB-like acyl-CoA dehydrogenase
MDFEFSSDAIMLRDMLRRFVEDEAKLLEMKYFSTGTLEPQDRKRLRTVIEQMGLWNITVPEKFGGGGLDLVTSCLLEEELGKTFVPLEIGDVPPLLYACQGDQIKNFLNPALAGKRRPFLAAREPGAFRPEDWKTTATPEGVAYLINGKKLLSAMPSAQDFLVVLAKTPGGISAFILDPNQSGIQINKNGGVVLQLEGCRAESGSLLGESGQALRLGIEDAPRACIQLGARYVGLADRLLTMSVEYAKSWVSLGAALEERPAVKRMLAETQVQIDSTRWLVYHTAWLADKHAPSRPAAAEVRLAAGEMLARTTELVTMIYGGPGPSPEIEVHRYIRSAVPMEALELGLECARTLVAAHILATSKEG